MEQILKEIEVALNSKLYLIALQTCLTLPDICGSIQSDSGKTTKNKYLHWYDEYVRPNVDLLLQSSDCYLFRCSMLHQGSTFSSPKKNQVASYTRIIFIGPDDQRITIHNCTLIDESKDDKTLIIDLHTFCLGMISSVRKWQKKMIETQNANYQTNMSKIIRFYPNGLSPYSLGISTIG